MLQPFFQLQLSVCYSSSLIRSYFTTSMFTLPSAKKEIPSASCSVYMFVLYTVNFLIYNTLNDSFQIEEQIANAFPEQIPFYEDDEAWLKRKQEERNAFNNTIS